MDLQVRLKNGFSISELKSKALNTLNIILNQNVSSEVVFNIDTDMIGLNETKSFLGYLKEYPDSIVEITFIFQNSIPGYEDTDEEGWWGFVTIRAANNDPIKYALAAALSIALAQLNDSLVLDENLIWTKYKALKQEEFIEKISIKSQGADPEKALVKFMEKIYSK